MHVIFKSSEGNTSSSFSQVKQHVSKMSFWRSTSYSAHIKPQIWIQRMTSKRNDPKMKLMVVLTLEEDSLQQQFPTRYYLIPLYLHRYVTFYSHLCFMLATQKKKKKKLQECRKSTTLFTWLRPKQSNYRRFEKGLNVHLWSLPLSKKKGKGGGGGRGKSSASSK